MKEYIKNIENKKLLLQQDEKNNKKQHLNGCHNIPQQIIAKSLKSPKQEAVDADDYQKDELSTIFKKLDAKYKTDSEKEMMIEDNNEGDGGAQQKSPPSEESPNTEDSSSSSVPKPMPRTSRNNSLPDTQPQSPQDSNSVIPKPRPRTSAGAYKV